MKNRLIDIIKLLISIIVLLCIGDISHIILSIFNINVDDFGIKVTALYQCILSFILFIVLLALYYDKFKLDLIKFKKELNKNISSIIKIFIIFMITKYIITIFTSFIIILMGYDTSSAISINQKMLETYVKSAPILMLISGSILAPFYEEGIFRLGFKKVINNKWIFIVFSGTIFGALHVFPLDKGVTLALGIIQSISYITMGMFLSYIYYKTDNIYSSIGVHFLNNFLSVLVVINMF